MASIKPINHHQMLPDIVQSLGQTNDRLSKLGLDLKIFHLVILRASQINGCGYCVKMHIGEARANNETTERIDRLVVWRHVSDFSEAEKSALEWAEALTNLLPHMDYATIRARLRLYFTDKEISILTMTVAMINMWNRIQVSKH